MSLTVVEGDANLKVMTGGHQCFADHRGLLGVVRRGTTDQDIGLVGLPNEGATVTYLYPNAASDGTIVTTTVP